jgi:exopolysaccharide production protein ExoZ
VNSNFSKAIQSLQLLRGIAVTLVIMAHAIDASGSFGNSYIKSFFYIENFGAAGVDIFFVISGVIITVIANNSQLSPAHFFAKRCIRVLPMYWGASFFCWVISLAGLWPVIKNQEILETLTIIPITKTSSGPVLYLGWTLSFEFLFYLIFTLALRINKKHTPIIVFTVLAILVLARYTLPAITDVRLSFVTNPIILELLLGCVCGHIYLSNTKYSKAIAYSAMATGILLLLFTVFNGFGNISEMGYTLDGSLSMLRVIKWGIPAFLLVTGMVLLEKNNALKIPAVLVTVGNISYSAYLVHIFCIMLVTTLWLRAGIASPDFFIVVAVIFSLCTAFFVYRFIEKPLTNYLNKIYQLFCLGFIV